RWLYGRVRLQGPASPGAHGRGADRRPGSRSRGRQPDRRLSCSRDDEERGGLGRPVRATVKRSGACASPASPIQCAAYLTFPGSLAMALNPYDLFDVRSLLSEDERAVQDAVARFTDERVIPIIGDAFDEGRFPKELVPE